MHIVGFIINKFVAMQDHMNVKFGDLVSAVNKIM